MTIFVGCDLGGTNIKMGLVDIADGKTLLHKSMPTEARKGHEVVMTRMAKGIDDLIAESGIERAKIGGVGVSAPGMLDFDKGLTLFLPNLHGQWRGVPLRDRLGGYLNLPVSMLNDVRAITLGEFTFGAGRGVQEMACFAIGTGIGGGLVVHGKLVLGISGTAGELGHMTVDVNGPRCGCGNHGCVETFASGPAIASMGIKAVQQGLTTTIGELVGYDLNKITPAIIAQAAEEGDEIAKEIWEIAGAHLGAGVANILHAIAPRRVVIAGGVAAAGELILDPVRREVERRVFLVPTDQVEIVLGELGSRAGILGVAQWASLQLE